MKSEAEIIDMAKDLVGGIDAVDELPLDSGDAGPLAPRDFPGRQLRPMMRSTSRIGWRQRALHQHAQDSVVHPGRMSALA